MTIRSQLEIAKWTEIIARDAVSASPRRLRAYIGSLVLGREFGEATEAYFARKGLTEFIEWADHRLGLGR